MKAIKLVISIFILLASVYLCQQIISLSVLNQIVKNDSAELNHIKYGLFSINNWKRQISTIVQEEIQDLDLSKSNRREIKKMVEAQLETLIDGIYKKIQNSNKKTFSGLFKQSLMDSFIDIKEVKVGIPEYADALILEMSKSKTEENLKNVAIKRIEDYLNRTFDNQDLTLTDRIITKIGSKDIDEARQVLYKTNVDNRARIELYTHIMIALSVILFALPGLSRQTLRPSQYIPLVISLCALLLVGVTTPMIDMEAKITKMSFALMGHPVLFENQILYFQSKSILDVFSIMINHRDLQMKFVGLLLVSFSVIFPLLKLLTSVFYYYNVKGLRKNGLIQFFVLKSGKWSMADVMVVAIFMAYIGFNGIITSQMGSLNTTDPDLVFIATNGTALQPGYYLFLTYTVLGLFLSSILTSKPKAYADD
ncbi:MAG TPA: paraquat-inducible protein A [Bacteriovoracaceae bacterium]|nr:paraquat-inducible protein A [Bacteriovoracaceae bacterium]